MTTKARFVVVQGPWGSGAIVTFSTGSLGAAIESVGDDVRRYVGRTSPREQAECFGAGIIARVIYVPAGETDDYDGPVVAEVRAGWGLA